MRTLVLWQRERHLLVLLECPETEAGPGPSSNPSTDLLCPWVGQDPSLGTGLCGWPVLTLWAIVASRHVPEWPAPMCQNGQPLCARRELPPGNSSRETRVAYPMVVSQSEQVQGHGGDEASLGSGSLGSAMCSKVDTSRVQRLLGSGS
ncbi:hypothetical protein P7K49_000524 [Saguinus oedipus]|uniref:Uncharacterized protein n=1 Tax=Saguinus oedipus TaxID=9490 RepID=A0ABQ9WEF6_SAGOE|nr:hypothetical protein P7K49_000524 [Saguinus oedipus]